MRAIQTGCDLRTAASADTWIEFATRHLTNYTRIALFVIRTFRSKKLKRFYETGDSAGLPSGQRQKLADVLAAVDSAEQPSDVAMFPGWRLHPLKGELTGFWSVSVSGNWRLLFRFEHGDAFDLDLVDYH